MADEIISEADIDAAEAAIAGTASGTPLIPSPFLTGATGGDVFLKLESMQPIGSFKLRGATNAIARLPKDAPGVVCASTGNHGRGIAFAAARAGVRAVICMSQIVPETKVAAIEALGAEVHRFGETSDDAEDEAVRLAKVQGLTRISAFDDKAVIAGQATVGREILAGCPDVARILVPLSGGGLAGGLARAVKAQRPEVEIIGVSMDRGASMHLSLAAGGPVDVEEEITLADALGGSIGLENRFSFEMCRRYLDGSLLVSEAQIYHALQVLFYEDRLIAEGACATVIAALMGTALPPAKGKTVAVISGRNIDSRRMAAIVAGEDIALGDMTLKGRAYDPAPPV